MIHISICILNELSMGIDLSLLSRDRDVLLQSLLKSALKAVPVRKTFVGPRVRRE